MRKDQGSAKGDGWSYSTLGLIGGERAGPIECKALDMLASRILARSSVHIKRATEGTPPAQEAVETCDVVFLVGMLETHRLLALHAERSGLVLPCLPDSCRVHPEGFAIKVADTEEKRYVMIAGADGRGTIYGVGAMLRLMTYLPNGVVIPVVDLRDKPAFKLRGPATVSGPNPVLTEMARMRPRTKEEGMVAFEDHVLLGANVSAAVHDELARSCGLMTYIDSCVNDLPGDFPAEWAATPHNSLHVKVNAYFRKRYVCPSIPEARAAILRNLEKRFRDSPGFDMLATKSGDVAGCACERCMPYGATFIRLLREVADVLHRYHPQARVMAANQNLTNEGDQAILDYLNQGDAGWFYALRYGPGGNEMSTYNRSPLNPIWFEYEGFGKHSNYLRYLHHELLRECNIVLFSDVTHWILSQYGVEEPDMALAVIYNRRAWNTRPRHFHRIASHTFHYAIGDLFYTEGMHDDFNKWFWYRMLWNPNLTAEQITSEYCRYWFGPEAEEETTRAAFLMEQTLEKPVIGNEGIAGAVELLRSARSKIPSNLLRADYRWRIIMQKALLDRYVQLWLCRGGEIKAEALPFLTKALESENPRTYVEKALEVLKSLQETQSMEAIREEVRLLGEESNRIIGYREPAYFNMKEFDVTEIGWWVRELERAAHSPGQDGTRQIVRMVVHYEEPGEGGFYERVGWPWKPVHLVEHENILGCFPFTGPARLHHYGMGYSWGGSDTYMVFRYDHLEPGAEYVIRISTGFHQDELKDVIRGEMWQSLSVNGVRVGTEIPLPLGDIRLFEFPVPRTATKDGKAEIVLRSEAGAFPMAGLNAIWFMRRDQMPWSMEGTSAHGSSIP